MGNPFCYVELTTRDLKGAKEFYSQMFDWKLEEFAGAPMPYFMVNTGVDPMGGMMGLPMPEVPTAWTVYIMVDDIDAACAKLTKLGGKVWKERTEVPEYGWFAVVSDPQGAPFALWQAKQPK
jgi:predicted enzyme related to lactoylglutathione lyase